MEFLKDMNPLTLLVFIIPVYHAFYTAFLPSMATKQAARVSTTDYLLATNRPEYERRKQEYEDLRAQIGKLAAGNVPAVNKYETIRETLAKIRASIFYNGCACDRIADVLMVMCVMEFDRHKQDHIAQFRAHCENLCLGFLQPSSWKTDTIDVDLILTKLAIRM